MSFAFYPRLALDGMRKNKKLYVPYVLSCAGMVAMYYILHALSRSPFVAGLPHGGDIGMILSLGKFVIAAFALLFLFYTSSFLTRRRNREFGLYSVLGMTKGNICRVVFWDSALTAAAGLVGGLALGVGFSKLAELGLVNMMRGDIGYRFTVSGESILTTAEIFGGIFLLLTLRSMLQVRRRDPLELMRSDRVGEKPLKANWVFAVIGAILLGAAYWMAVSIKNPLSALMLFFVAVLLVIAATYMLFLSGSVALCKALQKNKKYYYKKNHFIAVSSMSYRMKRNGAGLASICILSTMVLVMLSTTGSLYFGAEDAIRTRYPRNVELSVGPSLDDLTNEKREEYQSAYEETIKQYGQAPRDVLEYRYATLAGYLKGTYLNPDPSYDNYLVNYENVRSVYFVSAEDFNREMNTDYALGAGEALLYPLRCDYKGDELRIGDLPLHIVGRLDSFVELGEANSLMMPSLMLVVSDYEALRPLGQMEFGGESVLSATYYYGFNSDVDEETTITIHEALEDCAEELHADTKGEWWCRSGCVALERGDFFSTFGGMFFLGIVLSVVFLFAATVIIYYKQISEGYEDQKRFRILRDVGMTDTDIRKTINSQVLTVFFAPLIGAGLHLGFAFPFLWKILQMFALRNLPFVLCITAAAFAGFALFYVLIYKATARTYYHIVSSARDC